MNFAFTKKEKKSAGVLVAAKKNPPPPTATTFRFVRASQPQLCNRPRLRREGERVHENAKPSNQASSANSERGIGASRKSLENPAGGGERGEGWTAAAAAAAKAVLGAVRASDRMDEKEGGESCSFILPAPILLGGRLSLLHFFSQATLNVCGAFWFE